MAEVIKRWDDGTRLFVDCGESEAVFTSEPNEGIDREMGLTFRNASGAVAEAVVTQEGRRQRFVTADGKVFCVLSGGRFAVLKEGGIEPPAMETYTRLAYIESTGAQYINLDYIVQEDDEIEMQYVPTAVESGRLYGAIDATGNSIYWSFSAKNAYARFGEDNSKTISNGICSTFSILKKGSARIDTFETTMTFVGMPTTPLYLFACCDANGDAINKALCRCKRFVIRGKMELIPHRRNSDGRVGMLDVISGRFYVSEGDEFVMGGAVGFTEGYELLDYIQFDKDKLFDLGIMTNESSMDIQYRRNDATVAEYLYGVVNSGNTASFTAYLASNGAWRFGSQLVRPNVGNKDAHRTTIANGNSTHDSSSLIMNTSPEFVTPHSAVLGGYIDANGVPSITYSGKIYYVRINGGKELDWLPCRRLADGEEGFWDCRSQSFVESII